jgi:small-conductance mechanosensitive channel
LERIPETVRSIVEAQSSTRFDRAHFKGFGPSSLDFEIVYHVLTPDYNTHMDIQQSINLELCRQFERLGIDFAYPTQTLYLHRAPRRDGAGPDARQALRTGDHHAETAR